MVRDVSLRVIPGPFVGMVGPSGAGKTTLLQTMLGLAPRVTGMVQVGGQPVGPKIRPPASATCRRSKRSIGTFRSPSRTSS